MLDPDRPEERAGPMPGETAGDGPSAARVAFILDHTRLLPVPHAPEIVLHVADEVTALWLKTEDELGHMGLAPPFWAFAWAGGQALARYILDNPAIVAGRSVIDFASGSGLVAIAAMKAGAAQATAHDIDHYALDAISVNARANGVTVAASTNDIIGDIRLAADVVLFGDIFYERDMGLRLLRWIEALEAAGTACLIGDPGRAYLPKDRLEQLATYDVPVTRDLEDREIKRSSVWRLMAAL